MRLLKRKKRIECYYYNEKLGFWGAVHKKNFLFICLLKKHRGNFCRGSLNRGILILLTAT